MTGGSFSVSTGKTKNGSGQTKLSFLQYATHWLRELPDNGSSGFYMTDLGRIGISRCYAELQGVESAPESHCEAGSSVTEQVRSLCDIAHGCLPVPVNR